MVSPPPPRHCCLDTELLDTKGAELLKMTWIKLLVL